MCSVAQLSLTLCDPMDCSPPGSSVHGIIQARILEKVSISSSRASSQHRNKTHISCIGRWILYPWATWKAPKSLKVPGKDNVAVKQWLVRWKGERNTSEVTFVNWRFQLKHYCHLNCSLKNTSSSDSQKDVQSGLTFICLLETTWREQWNQRCWHCSHPKWYGCVPKPWHHQTVLSAKANCILLSSWV